MSSPCANFLFLIFVPVASCAAKIVTHLPGFNGPLPFHLETGYVNVGEDVELFYYFIHSEGNPKEDPLFLWLNGGPGCSDLGAILFDVGPLNIVKSRYDGNIPSLVYNPHSWTKVANVIFLDYLVDSGFSFSRSLKHYEHSDKSSVMQAYIFLTEVRSTNYLHTLPTVCNLQVMFFLHIFMQWFRSNTEFLSNPLYITGDSYGGKMAPLVVHKIIAEGNGIHQLYNIKGYIIGNPVTGELCDKNSQIPYAHGVGIIPDELFKEIEGHCEGEDYTNPSPTRFLCYNALDKFENFRSELNEVYILEPRCAYALPKPVDIVGNRSSLRRKDTEFLPPSPVPQFKCRTYRNYLFYFWVNNNATFEALHIKKDTVQEWLRCPKDRSYTFDIPSTVKYHKDITTRGYRALVYMFVSIILGLFLSFFFSGKGEIVRSTKHVSRVFMRSATYVLTCWRPGSKQPARWDTNMDKVF